MFKKIVGVIVFLILVQPTFAALTSLQCEYRLNSCEQDEHTLFYAYGNLSSNIRLNDIGLYNYAICCKSPFGAIDFSTKNISESCGAGEEIMYFTGDTNARGAVLFNQSHHNRKLCVNIPDEFSSIDIVVNESLNYEGLGYECIYRISDLTNGLVSSCDTTFAGSNTYTYTVWGRLWESLASLKCNPDCTSKLDGRVYRACSQKVTGCTDIPISCDGSLIGSWVPDLINPTKELKCEAPWIVNRAKAFTQDSIKVESRTGKCSNIIKKKYPIILYDNPVTMTVVLCN